MVSTQSGDKRITTLQFCSLLIPSRFMYTDGYVFIAVLNNICVALSHTLVFEIGDHDQPGVIPRAVDDVFSFIEQVMKAGFCNFSSCVKRSY